MSMPATSEFPHVVCAVSIDKLPMSDDDQALMPSAPPIHTMDAIQGYDAVAMDDGMYQ